MKIHTLDLNFQGRQKTIAAYLIESSGGPVLIETGPGSTLETLLANLAVHGYSPDDISHVLVTHIHLDHAGAAGWWANRDARLYVHHFGAPHLIDPTKLLSSAARIYGDQMDTLWGPILPVPTEQVTILHDRDVITIGDLSITALDTPGHAFHHMVYQVGDIAFTGDAAGIHIPGSTLVDLPAPPPDFHLTRWHQTIERLLDHSFTTLYPTHFGPVDKPRHHLEKLGRLLDKAAEFVRVRMEEGLDREAILADYLAWHRERAQEANLSVALIARYEAANPQFMSVDGIMRYWRKVTMETG